jgi:hypothetical protein
MGVMDERAPLALPMPTGLRTAETINTSLIVILLMGRDRLAKWSLSPEIY